MVFPVTVPDSAADWEAGPGFKSHHGIDLEAAAASLSLRLTQSLRGSVAVTVTGPPDSRAGPVPVNLNTLAGRPPGLALQPELLSQSGFTVQVQVTV